MRMRQCTALSDGIVEWSTASARRTFRPHCTTSQGNGTPFGWYLSWRWRCWYLDAVVPREL